MVARAAAGWTARSRPSTIPKMIERTPPAMSISSPLMTRRSARAMPISIPPVSSAQTTVRTTSTSAVIPGQRQAMSPAAIVSTPWMPDHQDPVRMPATSVKIPSTTR